MFDPFTDRGPELPGVRAIAGMSVMSKINVVYRTKQRKLVIFAAIRRRNFVEKTLFKSEKLCAKTV